MNQVGTILTTAVRFGVPTENIPREFHNVPVFRNPRLRTTLGKAIRDRRTGAHSIQIHKCVFADPQQMRSTLAHEIAHVIAGIGEGHGPSWKRIAQLLGNSGDRCVTAEAAQSIGIVRSKRPTRPVAECGKCGFVIERTKALPRGRIYSHRRCGGRFEVIA